MKYAHKPGYGIDEPRTLIELIVAGILSVAVGIYISGYTASTNPRTADTGLLVGPSVGGLILIVAAALYWSSRLGKPRETGKLVSGIPFGGNEVVLDLGCGRGLGAVLAAKKLIGGYVVGVDIFSKARLSGNDPTSVLVNAENDGVGSKVSALRGAPLHLPISDHSVDVVISGVAVHHLVPRKMRQSLFSEIKRILKDGGRIGVLDQGNGPEYSSIMNSIGLRDIETHRMRFSSFPPFHVVTARKPYAV